jgi:hypothetical protein
MEIRRAQAADWETLRQLRLAALADAPDAFASTLEAEVAHPDEVWRQRAEEGPTSASFIARERDVDVGLDAVFAEPDASGRMHLPPTLHAPSPCCACPLGVPCRLQGSRCPVPAGGGRR